jgi:tetratricopeptide (TPR) repeat protein
MGVVVLGQSAPGTLPPIRWPVLQLAPLSQLQVPEAKPPSEAAVVPVSDAPATRALIDNARVLLARGKADEARALVADRPDEDVAAAIVGAWADLRVGRDEQARTKLAAAAPADPDGDTALELALVLRQSGQRSEAEAIFDSMLESVEKDPESVPRIVRAARAAHALGRSRLANQYYREAASRLAPNAVLETWWGELFLERHNEEDAAQSFVKALDVDPRHVPALVGLARALADRNPPEAEARARAALETDSTAAGAHLVLAELALDNRKLDAAREEIDRALSINPRSTRGLALRAAVAAVEGRPDVFGEAIAQARAIDPTDAGPYRIAGEHLAGHYRFDEAVALSRQAVTIDPSDATARAALGMQLMRTGDEAAAREHLEAAFASDPFDRVTYNLLGLLDTMASFETVQEGDLTFRFPAEDAAVLRELAPAVAREAIEAMSRRYGFTPKGPLLIELFSKHDDFAVRTAGLPGMLGALGACFGRVVTLDAPRARQPGEFHWGATLWHELAHVFTLQMSNQRVPRWLTEGTSVFEERRARPQWGRESELAFVKAVSVGQAIPLDSLNASFSDPRRIGLAYQQSSFLVEMIVQQHGEEALHAMLRAYGDGLDDAAVFSRALQSDVASLQRAFDTYIEQRYGAMARALRVPEGVAVEGLDAAALVKLAEAHAGSFPIQMLAAEAALEAGDPASATPLLRRAIDLVPVGTGADGPRALLARASLDAGDKARAAEELERAVSADLTALDEARELAELAEELGDARRVVIAHQRISELVPHESASHSVIGRAAMADGDLAAAAMRFRLALAAGPANLAAARTDHAEVLVASGQGPQARKELIAALEDAPLYGRAQDLLLSIVDANRREGRPR